MSSGNGANSSGGKVSRACDACRVRKVRCSGDLPCHQCAHLNLACKFAPAPPKRKPGVRGRLVAQLRNSRSSGQVTTPPETSPTAAGHATPAVTSIAGIVESNPTTSPRSELSFTIGGCGYSADWFLSLLPDFEELLYPVNPVVTPQEIREAIYNMHNDYEDAAFVHVYGAVTINLTKTSWTIDGCDIASQMTTLMQYGLWAYRKAEMGQDGDSTSLMTELPVTVKRAMMCLWLHVCFMAFKRADRAFAVLREGLSTIQMLNIHQYREGDTSLSHRELTRRQRMYWEGYIHERFLFIMSGHPCTMAPLLTGLPFHDDSLPPHIGIGFDRIIQLFRNMDDSFLAYWSAQSTPNPHLPEMTAQWIETKQEQLDQDEADALASEKEMIANGHGALVELQHVDLYITRLWLRTLVWQLALSQGLLRSTSLQNTHQGLSLHFPAQRLSAQLRNLVTRLKSISSVLFHGSGILQKLFEITSTIADVLALPRGPGQSEEEARARLEDFFFLVRFLFSFERAQKHQRDYLREKLEVLQKMYTVVDFRELAGASPTT